MVKYNKVFRILALAVIFSLLMVVIPVTPALAATFTISASSGPVGTAITVTTGSGFTTDGSGRVWFDSNDDGDWDSGEPYLSATVSGGILSAPGSLAVPTVPRTTYQVRVDILPSGVDAEADFTVTPQITLLTPSSGNVGDTVTVSGNGFAAGSVTILFDDVSKGTTTATATGTFTGFSLTVPESTKGSHTVKAQETSSISNNDTVSFTVSAKIIVTPASGAVGDTVTINGTGFAASSNVTFYFDNVSVGTDTSTNKGSFTNSTFTIPSTSRGSHTIKAQDASGNYATATFTVAHKMTITPTSGASGISVRVSGTGFGANKPITIEYNDNPVTTNPATITTDANGSFSASFNVPASIAGTYPVEASDGTNTASANFVATTDATISQTTSEASPGHVGMELTINGTGFKANHDITITYASEPVVFHTNSLADGSFSYTFKVPPSVGGNHAITVTDGYTTKPFTFVMESAPPPIPPPLLPMMGVKAKAKAYFDWEDVGDVDPPSNPVTYTLQIASDANFTSLLLEKTGLTTSEYTLTDAEKLESTKKEAPYYWRLRAVDAAANASGWTTPGTFYVGFIFGFPELKGWVLYALMGAGGLLLFFLGLWVGRRGGGAEEY